MTLRILDTNTLISDLKRLARGKTPTMPVQFVAEWALEYVEAGLEQTDVEQLEALYSLDDPR